MGRLTSGGGDVGDELGASRDTSGVRGRPRWSVREEKEFVTDGQATD